MDSLIELIPVVVISVFFLLKCVRFKPQLELVNPFKSNVAEGSKKQRPWLLFPLALIAVPLFLIGLLLLLSGGDIQVIDSDAIIEERFLADMKLWAEENMGLESPVFYDITYEGAVNRSGLATFTSNGRADRRYVVQYRVDRGFEKLEIVRGYLLNVDRMFSEKTWTGGAVYLYEPND